MDWISVKDRLPEVNTRVLALKYNDEVGIGLIIDIGCGNYQWTIFEDYLGALFLHGDSFGVITHWMPLPDPPDDSATYPQTIGNAQDREE